MDVNQLTKISLAWEMYEQHVPKSHIAQTLDVQRETVHIWISKITTNSGGLLGFLDEYSRAKKGPRPKRQVDPLLKRWVWSIREREILAEKYVIKSKWKKNTKRGAVPKASRAREVIQMDSVDFGEVFAFTAVDIFSREVDILLAPELTSNWGARFLDQAMNRRFDGFSDLIQSDGGPEFKDKFKKKVYKYTNRYRISAPYKKNEQSYIESFNRTVRKECLGWAKYRKKQIKELTAVVNIFLERYHYHRPHISLGMRPPLTRG